MNPVELVTVNQSSATAGWFRVGVEGFGFAVLANGNASNLILPDSEPGQTDFGLPLRDGASYRFPHRCLYVRITVTNAAELALAVFKTPWAADAFAAGAVTISGTPNVAVTNTPNVAVTNTPNVALTSPLVQGRAAATIIDDGVLVDHQDNKAIADGATYTTPSITCLQDSAGASIDTPAGRGLAFVALCVVVRADQSIRHTVEGTMDGTNYYDGGSINQVSATFLGRSVYLIGGLKAARIRFVNNSGFALTCDLRVMASRCFSGTVAGAV